MIEHGQGYGSDADSRVGHIEYGSEEGGTSHKGHPGWPLEERKIEHVDNAPFKKASIPLAEGHQLSWLRHWAGGGEDEPIEGVVYNVAQGTGYDEGKAGYEPKGGATLDLGKENPHKETHGQQAKEGKKKCANEVHAKSHSVVFGEKDLKPAGYVDVLVEVHAGLYEDFCELVYGEHHDDDACRKQDAFFHWRGSMYVCALLFVVAHVFGLYAEGGMWHGAQPLFGD